MSDDAKRRDPLIAGAVGLALFSIFWFGRSHSFGAGDSAQHVLCALTWGVPHPPGYPLQTALGWLWSRLWSDPGAAVNGLSGLFAAAAGAVLFLLLRKNGCRRAAALTAAAFMALSPLFWYYSLVAEVRALNDLLALSAAYFAIEWSKNGRIRSLYLFAAVFGLGASHHPTFVLLVPAFAVWLSARRPAPRAAARAGGIALAALVAPYALLRARLAWSAPAYNLFETSDWRGLAELFLRTRLGGPMRMAAGGGAGFAMAELAAQLANFASALWTHAGPVVLALAAAGVIADVSSKNRRSLLAWSLWFFAAAAVPIALSSAEMSGHDPDYVRAVVARFDLLPMIAVFVLSGRGAEALLSRARPALGWALAAAAFVFPLGVHPQWLARANPQLDAARALVRDSKPGDLVVLGADDSVFAALELELARGEGGGRIFLTPSVFGLPSYARVLARRYPDLRVPPPGPDGLTLDWAAWLALNPGRAVLFEPGLLDAARSLYPMSIPQGTLIRVLPPSAQSDPAADARRFLASPEIAEVTRWNVRPWTQEIYLLKTRSAMAAWLSTRLDPKRDAALLREYAVVLSELRTP
jgi:hypothetical protein